MMMPSPLWLLLFALCVVGMMTMISHCSREGSHRGLMIAIGFGVGALVMMRVLRIMPSFAHLIGLAAAGALVTVIACMPSCARRKLATGALVVIGLGMAGFFGLRLASQHTGGLPFGMPRPMSATDFHAGGPRGVHIRLADAGHAADAQAEEESSLAPPHWNDSLDDIIAKLEQSKGHPPIARLISQMHALRDRLDHLDTLITDPQARAQLNEKLSQAMAALNDSVDLLERMDQHELSNEIRGQLKRWGDIVEQPPPPQAPAPEMETPPEVPTLPLAPQPPAVSIAPRSPAPAQVPESLEPADHLDRQSAWRREAESAFQADLYPSAESAGRALARALAPLIEADLPSDQPAPKTIEIGGRANRLEPDIGYALAAALRERFEGANIDVIADDLLPTPPAGDASVRIIIDHKFDDSTGHDTAIIRAHLFTAEAEYQRTRRYIDKPWLTRFDEYVSSHPGQSLFLARSALAHTREEASRQAVADAVAQVKPMVIDFLAQHSSIARDPDWRFWADGWLDDHLANSVLEGWIVADRFAQRLTFHAARGDQWREAMLIRVESDNLSALESIARSQFRTDRAAQLAGRIIERRANMTTAGAAVGLIALLTGVYLFLQAATRGYYTLMIRLTVLAAVLAGVLGLVWMRQNAKTGLFGYESGDPQTPALMIDA